MKLYLKTLLLVPVIASWNIRITAAEMDTASLVEEQKIANLVTAFSRDDFCIGEFQELSSQELDNQWHEYQAEYGEFGEFFERYRFLKEGGGWEVFRLIKPIKGDIAKLVFLNEPSGLGMKQNFLSSPGSRWILVLKPAFDTANRLVVTGVYTNMYSQAKLSSVPFLNRRNLFVLYDMNDGAFCLEWPPIKLRYGGKFPDKDVSRPKYIKLYTEDFANGLRALQDAVTDQKQRATKLMSIEGGVKEPTVKAVAVELFKKERAK